MNKFVVIASDFDGRILATWGPFEAEEAKAAFRLVKAETHRTSVAPLISKVEPLPIQQKQKPLEPS